MTARSGNRSESKRTKSSAVKRVQGTPSTTRPDLPPLRATTPTQKVTCSRQRDSKQDKAGGVPGASGHTASMPGASTPTAPMPTASEQTDSTTKRPAHGGEGWTDGPTPDTLSQVRILCVYGGGPESPSPTPIGGGIHLFGICRGSPHGRCRNDSHGLRRFIPATKASSSPIRIIRATHQNQQGWQRQKDRRQQEQGQGKREDQNRDETQDWNRRQRAQTQSQADF